MAQIKSLEQIKSKWGRRTSNAAVEYEEGIRNPRKDWAQETAAAEANFEKGVQAAIQAKRFGKGVNKAGTAKWQSQALLLGPSRFTQGVQGAEDAYATGFAPYRETIQNINLPPRGPKGSPENIRRVSVLTDALHKKKLDLLS